MAEGVPASPKCASKGSARPPLLEVTHLHVRYGPISALKGVSLSVCPGEVVAILGANGAGKSTLMRALAGLEPVWKGEIRFNGESIAKQPSHRRSRSGIALVLEGRSVFAPLSVRENLRLGMLSEGLVGKHRLFTERMDWVCAIFPALRSRTEVRAGELSGGQQQMLAIARALMSKPRFLLLDEPSFGLAPIIVEELFQTLIDLNQQTGLTVLLAEQNIDNALAIADRAYVFEVGEVAIADTAEHLLEKFNLEDIYLGRSGNAGYRRGGDLARSSHLDLD
jgi:branched-chain amino acid transport system ATP-binding protein